MNFNAHLMEIESLTLKIKKKKVIHLMEIYSYWKEELSLRRSLQ